MKRILLLALLICAAIAPAAHAVKFSRSKVIIPVVGRFPGAYGSQWRTDVFVRNIYENVGSVTLTFFVTNGPVLQSNLTVTPYSTTTLHDVVKNIFGLDQAAGQLHLVATDTSIEARARIFNTGNPAGQFGQGVEGMCPCALQRQALMFGLDGTNGNRVNVGVANPNDVAVQVLFLIVTHDRNSAHSETSTLQPHETRQFNDIFTAYGIAPQENVSVEFNSLTPDLSIYGYSSEVRNDTGDAVFVFGTGPNV